MKLFPEQEFKDTTVTETMTSEPTMMEDETMEFVNGGGFLPRKDSDEKKGIYAKFEH